MDNLNKNEKAELQIEEKIRIEFIEKIKERYTTSKLKCETCNYHSEAFGCLTNREEDGLFLEKCGCENPEIGEPFFKNFWDFGFCRNCGHLVVRVRGIDGSRKNSEYEHYNTYYRCDLFKKHQKVCLFNVKGEFERRLLEELREKYMNQNKAQSKNKSNNNIKNREFKNTDVDFIETNNEIYEKEAKREDNDLTRPNENRTIRPRLKGEKGECKRIRKRNIVKNV